MKIESANFTAEPVTRMLNGQILEMLIENTWFVNEQITAIPAGLTLENVEFRQPIELKVRTPNQLCESNLVFSMSLHGHFLVNRKWAISSVRERKLCECVAATRCNGQIGIQGRRHVRCDN